jgi:hypothetical protein
MAQVPLEYRGPEPKRQPPDPVATGVLAASSLGMAAVPFVGLWMRNGPLFLVGGLIAPVIGTIIAVTGILRGWSFACGFALLANAVVAAGFVWLIFVRGLC